MIYYKNKKGYLFIYIHSKIKQKKKKKKKKKIKNVYFSIINYDKNIFIF